MKKLNILLIILSIGFKLSAQFNCQETKQLIVSANDLSINNNAKSDTFDILNYSINLDLTNITSGQLIGTTDVSFKSKIQNANKLNLDLVELNVDSVFIVSNGNPQTSGFQYSYNDSVLAIIFNQAPALSDTTIVRVHYSGIPLMDASGWGGFHAASGYYYNLGVGFAANPHTFGRAWFPCFDNFVEKSTYAIAIKSVDPLRPLITGDKINHQVLNGDTILSSSSLMEPIPSYLSSFALSNYIFIEDTVQGLSDIKDIVLACKPSDSLNMVNSFRNLKKVFHAFETYFGPYEWPRIGYAATTVGAMEHSTSIHYPISLINGNLSGEDIMAHELAHHWFGNLITCETAENMWINEGMAEFCSHLYTEAVYGQDRYLETIRDNAYNVLNFAHVNDNSHRAIFGPTNDLTYGYHTYQKGAMVGHNLKHYMGDSLFYQSLKTLFQNNKYGNLNTVEFRDQLINISGNNHLYDFFDNWIYAPGFPQFSVDEWTYSELTQRVDVSLKQRLYATTTYHTNVPVDVTFFGKNGEQETLHLNHSGKTSSHPGILMFEPRAVLASYGGNLLTATSYDHLPIVDNTSLNAKYGEAQISVSNFLDSGSVIVMHHLVPAEKKANNPFDFKLSNVRYWTIQKLGLENTEINATLDFDGSSRGRDRDLLANGNDSLVVLYRAQGTDIWNIWPYQTKNNNGSSSFTVGDITIENLQSGDYVFANTAESVSLLEAQASEMTIVLYPNPTNDILNVTIAKNRKKKDVNIELYDLKGNLLVKDSIKSNAKAEVQFPISFGQYASGNYTLVVDGKVFIVQHSN